MNNASCPFCGSGIVSTIHPPHATCGLATWGFTNDQWQMRPPKKEQPVPAVTSEDATAFPNFVVKGQSLTHWIRTETKHGDQIEVVKTGSGMVALYLKRTNVIYLVFGEG